MLREFGRNAIEKISDIFGALFVLLGHVVFVEREDLLFNKVGCRKIFLRHEGRNDLRHSADEHVFSKDFHHRLV